MALVTANPNGATPFKFANKGDTIKGYYKGQTNKTINGSPVIEHTYRTPNGVVSVLGQANILKQLAQEGVTPGTYVEITYTGELIKLKGGRTMKSYVVRYDLEDRDNNSSPANEEDYSGFGEEISDESTPSLSTAPRVAASSPSASAQARVQALLNRK